MPADQPPDQPSRAALIPRWLAIPWWWLLVATVAESFLSYMFLNRNTSIVVVVWSLAQAVWLRKVLPQSRAIYWYAAYFLWGFLTYLPHEFLSRGHPAIWGTLSFLYGLGMLVLGVGAIFVFRDELVFYFRQDEELAYFTLSGVITFFFSIYYFQYWLHDLARRERDDRRKAMFTSV